jgi:serine protease inhibitor
MIGQPNAERVISIGKIVHKAVLDVAEDGTEAAAATAVEMFERSAMTPGAIRFQGRIIDPR